MDNIRAMRFNSRSDDTLLYAMPDRIERRINLSLSHERVAIPSTKFIPELTKDTILRPLNSSVHFASEVAFLQIPAMDEKTNNPVMQDDRFVMESVAIDIMKDGVYTKTFDTPDIIQLFDRSEFVNDDYAYMVDFEAEFDKIFEFNNSGYTLKQTRDGTDVDYLIDQSHDQPLQAFKNLLKVVFPDKATMNAEFSIGVANGLAVALKSPIGTLTLHTGNIPLYENDLFEDTYGFGFDFRYPFTIKKKNIDPTFAYDDTEYFLKIRAAAAAYRMLYLFHDRCWQFETEIELDINGASERKKYGEWISECEETLKLWDSLNPGGPLHDMVAKYLVKKKSWEYIRREEDGTFISSAPYTFGELNLQKDRDEYVVDYPYFAEIEAEYLRMTGVALQSQYDPETNTFVDKSSMPRQVALNTRIIRIVTALQYAFGDRFDLAAKIAAHDAGRPFSYDLLPVLDILKNKPAQNCYPKMKEVLAWNQYVMGEVGDHIFTINGQSTRSHGTVSYTHLTLPTKA